MNHTTRIIAATYAIALAVAIMNHGLFETFHGFKPTEGLIIQAIPADLQMWVHGSEEAFTLIPNYLITGFAAMTVGIVIIVFALRYLHIRQAAWILLGLFILSFLVGGGIGQIVLFTPLVLFASRINQPLAFWRRVLPANLRPTLARLWLWLLVPCVVFLAIALEIAVFGWFPPIPNPDTLLNFVFLCLLLSIASLTLAFISGFAADIERQPTSA